MSKPPKGSVFRFKEIVNRFEQLQRVGVDYLDDQRLDGKLFRGFESDIPNLEKKLAQFPDPEPQEGDFSHCVRTRRKFALNEVSSHRSCTLVNLGKAAVRLGRNLKFDPDEQRFIGDEAANRLIDQPMRAPWDFRQSATPLPAEEDAAKA